MSGAVDLPSGVEAVARKAGSAWVCLPSHDLLTSDLDRRLTAARFMFEHIMPLSDAVEAYDLFDKMKAQKVVFEINKPEGAST